MLFHTMAVSEDRYVRIKNELFILWLLVKIDM